MADDDDALLLNGPASEGALSSYSREDPNDPMAHVQKVGPHLVNSDDSRARAHSRDHAVDLVEFIPSLSFFSFDSGAPAMFSNFCAAPSSKNRALSFPTPTAARPTDPSRAAGFDHGARRR